MKCCSTPAGPDDSSLNSASANGAGKKLRRRVSRLRSAATPLASLVPSGTLPLLPWFSPPAPLDQETSAPMVRRRSALFLTRRHLLGNPAVRAKVGTVARGMADGCGPPARKPGASGRLETAQPTAAWNFECWQPCRLGNTPPAERPAPFRWAGSHPEWLAAAATSLSGRSVPLALPLRRTCARPLLRPSSMPQRCRDDARAGKLRQSFGCCSTLGPRSGRQAQFQRAAPPPKI